MQRDRKIIKKKGKKERKKERKRKTIRYGIIVLIVSGVVFLGKAVRLINVCLYFDYKLFELVHILCQLNWKSLKPQTSYSIMHGHR